MPIVIVRPEYIIYFVAVILTVSATRQLEPCGWPCGTVRNRQQKDESKSLPNSFLLVAMASNLMAMASNPMAMASNLMAMASNPMAMSSNLMAMASNPMAMASNLVAMVSTLIAMAST